MEKPFFYITLFASHLVCSIKAALSNLDAKTVEDTAERCNNTTREANLGILSIISDMSNNPLCGSTFTTYRLSPLYHGPSPLLTPSTLKAHAACLSDVLKGDILRGVDIGQGYGSQDLSKSGPLQRCSWSLLDDQAEDDEEEDAVTADVVANDARGIHIRLQFEKVTYAAFLLRNPPAGNIHAEFTSLPLLLVRMPTALREAFLAHLSVTFDTHIAPMKLRSTFLTSSIERLIQKFTAQKPSQQAELISNTVNSVQIQFSFPDASPALKSIDISIDRKDIAGFVSSGEILAPQASGRTLIGANTNSSQERGPFMRAFAMYLSSHLALTLPHPRLVISKIACGVFALSGEGKIKLFAPHVEGLDDAEADIASTSWGAALSDFCGALVNEASSNVLSSDQGTHAQAERRAEIITSSVKAGEPKKSKSSLKANKKSALDAVDDLAAMDIDSTQGTDRGRERIPTDPPPPYTEFV